MNGIADVLKLMDRKYDIKVRYMDASGQYKWRDETGVVAANPKELAGIYEMVGEKIQIMHDYGPVNTSSRPDLAEIDGGMPLPPEVKMLPMPTTVSGDVTETGNQVVPSTPIPSGVPPATHHVFDPPKPMKPKKKEVKYFRINGVDCKVEDGKIFQKQWVKLIGSDLNNYRILSEKTNKIIPFTGKVLEVLRWIQLDDTNDETANMITEIINGDN